jgi:hypothetical protein
MICVHLIFISVCRDVINMYNKVSLGRRPSCLMLAHDPYIFEPLSCSTAKSVAPYCVLRYIIREVVMERRTCAYPGQGDPSRACDIWPSICRISVRSYFWQPRNCMEILMS